MYVYTCFSCGKNINVEKCPYCGYSTSLTDECPRKQGVKCIHTNKLCSIRKYEECKVLRKYD